MIFYLSKQKSFNVNKHRVPNESTDNDTIIREFYNLKFSNADNNVTLDDLEEFAAQINAFVAQEKEGGCNE